MKKFATLATGAVVASTIVPVFAANPNDTLVTVDLTEVTIAVTGDFDFDGNGSGGFDNPGDAMVSDAVSYVVTTNNADGYSVELALTDLEKAGVRASLDDLSQTGDDRIDNEDISVNAHSNSRKADAAGAEDEAVAYDKNAPDFADAADVLIADSAIRSHNLGDAFSITLGFTMPWIETGAYAGEATWTVTDL